MMKLLWSPRSPFVRKVMIVLHETGLETEVEKHRYVVAMNMAPAPDVLQINPLGKIPALVCEDGTPLFDSRVICEYLAHKSDTQLFPKDFPARMTQLRWQALGDGLSDILLLWRIERSRGDCCHPEIARSFEIKVRHALQQLEHEADQLKEMPFAIGHIAIICALGQLDFRWPGTGWQTEFSKLGQWYQTVCLRPSVKANPIINDDVAKETSHAEPIFTFGKD